MTFFRATVWIHSEEVTLIDGGNSDPNRKIREHLAINEEQFKTIVRREFQGYEVSFGPISKRIE